MTDSSSTVSLSKLIQIPELVETILSHLPIRDLLHAQLVSRTWHRTISSSPTLQKCLFFAPSSSPLSEASREYNPLLLEKFLPWFLDIHPCIDSREQFDRSGAGSPSVTESTFTFLDWNNNEKKRSAYKRKEASWRKMLVAQPPIKELVVVKTRCAMHGRSSKREGRVSIEGGLTMGLLYDLAYDQVRVGITSVVMEWGKDEDEEGVRGLEGKREIGQVKMLIQHIVQCMVGGAPRVGSEFKSEAFKPLDIEFGEWVRISRH